MHALSMMASGPVREQSEQVRQGEFDSYLLQHLSPLAQLMSQGVLVNAFGDLVGGLVLFGAATVDYPHCR